MTKTTSHEGHEGHEAHEVRGKGEASAAACDPAATSPASESLRVASPLDPATEDIVRRTIGAGIEVHRQLGPGLLEAIYVDALTIELERLGLSFERERPVTVKYRGIPLRPYRIDLIVERRLIVEAKAVSRLDRVHQAQVLSYMRATEIRVGLLLNFNAIRLADGLKRFVL